MVLATMASVPGAAVAPERRQHSSFDDFSAGEAHGVSISSDGAVRAAPALTPLAKLDAERIWSLAAREDGALFVGTGDAGKLYRVDESGDAELVFASPGVAVQTLEFDGRGRLHVGTSPDGLIYRIEEDGGATAVAETGSRYVWDLAFDARDRLLAAVGEPGRVVRIAEDALDTLWTAPERHVMALLLTPDAVVAATAGPPSAAPPGGEGNSTPTRAGRVYELATTSGPYRLVCETGFDEIHHIVPGADGALIVAAVAETPGEGEARSAVLRVDRTGAITPLWQTDGVLLDLKRELSGALLAATGNEERGQLVRVFPDRREHEIVARVDTLVPNRLLVGARGVLVGGAHGAEVWRLAATFAGVGDFLSRVEDMRVNARWGHIEWDAEIPAGTRLQLATRSGNSADPDPSWSEWSQAPVSKGALPARAAIPSPAARYLQYRARLHATAARSPTLTRVAVSGQQTNLAPQITELETFPFRSGQSAAGNVAPDQGAVSTVSQGRNGRRSTPGRKSLRMVRWKAQDRNGDKLVYDIFLRGEDQREWKLAKGNWTQTSLLWDSESMPEGRTQVKLVASDRPANPPAQALQHERVSDPFLLDNSPPEVRLESRGGRTHLIHVEIVDSVSEIVRAQYSIDYGEEVFQLEPDDGIFDSLRETARFAVADLEPGEHVIAVQAWDRLENIGSQQVVLTIVGATE